MIGPLLKKLGCCGVVVWLLISGVIATFYVGEYLERPAEQQSFWKAGVMVKIFVIIITISYDNTCRLSYVLVLLLVPMQG